MSDTKRVKAQPTELVRAKPFDQVRLCYPNPDIVCLEGGCIHCDNSATWWTIDALRVWAYKKSQHHWTSFIYGRDHMWHSRAKKFGDDGEPFHGTGAPTGLE
jgi:hypothetical protein